MKTAEKISEAARRLFNERGMREVTVRVICSDLKISLGNFSYHYPDRDQLIVRLYHQMLEELQGVFAQMRGEPADIRAYLRAHRRAFEVQYKYRFFFIHIVEILQHSREIRELYLANAALEREMAGKMLDMYVREGILKPTLLAADHERLTDLGRILSNGWAIDAALHEIKEEKQLLIRYLHLCCSLLLPYLTDAALAEFQRYFQELEEGLLGDSG